MRKLAKWFEEALESYVKLMGNTYEWGRHTGWRIGSLCSFQRMQSAL